MESPEKTCYTPLHGHGIDGGLRRSLVKAVIIGTSGHIDLALEIRDRLPQVTFVGIASGSVDEDAREFFVDRLEESFIPFYMITAGCWTVKNPRSPW